MSTAAVTGLLRKLFTCNFAAMPVTVFSHLFMNGRRKIWRKSLAMTSYYHCAAKASLSTIKAKCHHYLKVECQSAKIIAVKIIRARMDTVRDLLPMFPDLKIIHQGRDPRGILNSRFQSANREKQAGLLQLDQRKRARDLCEPMMKDVVAGRAIIKEYRQSLLNVVYEQLADNVTAVAKEIYNFIGMIAPPHVLAWLEESTHAAQGSSPIGTSRVNSSAVARRWRQQMESQHISVITAACRTLLEELGYSTAEHG